jgi:hypothetical protein
MNIIESPTCDPQGELSDVSKLIDTQKILVNSDLETKVKAKETIASTGSIVGKISETFSSSLGNLIDSVKNVITKNGQSNATHTGNVTSQSSDKDIAESHDTQDAKAEIIWTPLVHPDVLYTTLIDLKPAGYSTYEDYPNSKGWVNEENDFEKRNFITGEWWDCHHSGYLRKVDGDGNYETKIPGTELYYTFGDRGNVCASNEDNLVMMNKYNHVMQEMTEIVDGDVNNTYNMNITETILLSQIEAIGVARSVVIGVSDSLHVNMNQNISVGGNINITAGGIITLKGSKILLN